MQRSTTVGLLWLVFFVAAFCASPAFGQDDRRGEIGIEFGEEDWDDLDVRTSGNLRPCRGYNQTDTNGNEDYFMSRCTAYAPEPNCSVAWQLFSGVWNQTFYDLSNPPNYTAFIEYFNWKGDMQSNGYQPIFYAGSGQCPDIVHKLTNVTNINLITLEDQNGPYSVANAGWCAPQYWSAGSCAFETTWGYYPNGNQFAGYNNYPGAAFWGPASHHFGVSAFGTVWALVRSFERGETPAPAFGSGIFPDVELPTVLSQPDVTAFKVVVVTNTNQPAETCGNGSLVTMVNRIKQNLTNVECITDPPCLLQFFCDENLPNYYGVPITNKDHKCAYYNALVAANLDVSTNCNCSLDSVTLSGEQWLSTSAFCPQLNVEESSQATKIIDSWIILGMSVIIGMIIA